MSRKGINSVLSSYDAERPSRLIGLWLNKLPVIFLVIATLAFAFGLNFSAYLSSRFRFTVENHATPAHVDQERYTTPSPNTLFLFVLDGLLIYRLKNSIGTVVKEKLMILLSAISLPISLPVLWILGQVKSDKGIHYLRNLCWCVLAGCLSNTRTNSAQGFWV